MARRTLLTVESGVVLQIDDENGNIYASGLFDSDKPSRPEIILVSGVGPGGTFLQTDGTSNSLQSLLNLISGTGITLTANGSGGVTVALSQGQAFTILSDTGAPSADLGIAGDFYIDTTAHAIYGPKTSSWGSSTSLIGPAGTNGTNGVTGSKWYEGATAPNSGTGIAGDYYLNTATGDVYTKTIDGWGAPISNLKGPRGASGSPGPTAWLHGAVVPDDGTGADSDYYINTATGDVYQKVSGSWGSAIMNITGPVGSGELQTAFVDLLYTDLLAIADTPKQLIASAGEGNIILLQSLMFQINPGDTPYIDAGGDSFKLMYGSSPQAATGPNFTGFLTSATFEALVQNNINGGAWAVWPASIVDQPIMITATGNPTSGDGFVRVRAWYVVHNVEVVS